MHSRLRIFSLATTTLLISLTSPFLPIGSFEHLSVQAQITSNRKTEAAQLLQQGFLQYQQGIYKDQDYGNPEADQFFQQSLKNFKQALEIYREIGDSASEGTTLNNIGVIYRNLEQPIQSFESYQQALEIHRELGDRTREGTTLYNIAEVYRSDYDNKLDSSSPQQYLEYYNQALTIAREVENRRRESIILITLGEILETNNSSLAFALFQQVIDIQKEASNLTTEKNDWVEDGILDNSIEAEILQYKQLEELLSSPYWSPGFYSRRGYHLMALSRCLTLLLIVKGAGDRVGEGTIWLATGIVYSDMEDYSASQSLESYQQALAIFREINDREGESEALNAMGRAYDVLGQYSQALEVYQLALAIDREMDDRGGQGIVLNNIGDIYTKLGQYTQAMEFYQQAVIFHREEDNNLMEVITLNNLGRTYIELGQYAQAIESYEQLLDEQLLDEHQQDVDPNIEARIYNNMGLAYNRMGNYEMALQFYVGSGWCSGVFSRDCDRRVDANTRNGRGVAYHGLRQYPQALESYQQALTIFREIGEQAGESITFANIGRLLIEQNQPELAIAFYKQSVNITEAIRTDLQALPQEQQQSYAKTVADTYRGLANLLLQQNRVLEAQEVLDLLKLQELDDYLRNVRGNKQTAQGLDLWQAEQRILEIYEQMFSPNGDEQGRSFETFLNHPDVIASVEQLKRNARGQNLNPDQLARLQDNLQQLGDTALLYPLILEDRVELVLVTPSSLVRKTVAVERVKLNEAIANFRSDLTNPSRNPIPNAQQLYQWLIQPLEDDLEQAKVNTILYAADGQLRYIPLAALHNGNQWLIQRFSLNHITAASLTNFSRNGTRPLQILAAAYSDPQLNYQFQIGEDQFNFNGLTFAGIEVETLAKEIPNTKTFFNQDFSLNNIEPRLGEYSIVHLATHAKFVSTSPHDSFILFGSGERVTLADINKWKLSDVDLVVLSACQTAASGELGNGEEILGFGYQIQRTGAEAAIASLWTVDDGGTQALMNAFYAALQTEKVTKAEALRQAQIALISGDYSALGEQRGILVVERIRNNLSSEVQNRLTHPYYWAPFILIGNGL